MLSALLQLSPMVRVALMNAGGVVSPVVAVLRWIVGVAAVNGAFHAVSAATGLTVKQGTSEVTSVKGTNSVVLLGCRALISSDTYHEALSYDFKGLPPGLKGSLQGVVTGSPTNTGAFIVTIIGYEKPSLEGHTFETAFPFNISDQAPLITGPPTNQTVAAGATVTFAVTASGTSLKYRWLKNDIELPQAVATNATYTIKAAKASDAASYKVRLSNGAGVVLSTPVTLTVTQGAPTVSVSPPVLDLHEGEAATFTAQAVGNGPFTYQWRRGTELLPTATNATLDFLAALPAEAATYTVAANSAAGGATSGPVTLSVFAQPRLSLSRPALTVASLLTTSISNRSYVLEFLTGQSAPAWSAEQTNLAGGATLTFTNVNISTSERFWRVRVVPLMP